MGRGACPQILRGICSAPVGFPVTLHYPTEWSRYFRNRLSFSGNVESCVVGHCMENIPCCFRMFDIHRSIATK